MRGGRASADHRHDYVVVGAGSAGCAVAGRLSEAGASVVLIEAGGSDRHPNVRIPAAFAKQFGTRLDWDHRSGPEPGCEGRSLYVPRGKSLGGSSSMNAMLYARGHRADYDGWRDAGCRGWGWDQVLPHFIRAERNSRGASELHGGSGPLCVTDPRSPSSIDRRFLEAAAAAGARLDPDYNDGEPDGAALAQVTQRSGRRWSAADAYLRPALRRPNLTLLARCTALGVVLDGERASGVRYLDRRGRARLARASREVILCAGAISSPQLLLLSGVGPPEELRSVGVEARVELPGVGRNLQDHPYVVCVGEATRDRTLHTAERPRYVLEWMLRRSGPLTSTAAEAFLYERSAERLPLPDLQFHFAPVYFVRHGAEPSPCHSYTLGPVLVAPRARGSVRLRSANPTAKPSIVGNHLVPPEDLAALVSGVKRTRELMATEPLASGTGAELYPGPDVVTDAEIEADVRRRVELLYHPVGTCAMGTHADAVVDPELRVRGVDGLRVMDASIMPTITRGNTNAPTIMIGERGAELVAASAA